MSGLNEASSHTSSDEPMSDEARRADSRGINRIPLRLAVSARGVSAPLGQTRDISLQGVFVETSEPFDVGAVLPISLDLDSDGKPLMIRAEVVRRVSNGMGLRFDAEDQAAVRRLRRWIVDQTSVVGTQRQVEQLHAASSHVEPIRTLGRLREKLEEIQASREKVTLVPPDRLARDYGRLTRIQRDGIEFALDGRSTLREGEEVYALITLAFVSYSFGLRVLSVDDNRVLCALPEVIVYSERRSKDRATAPEGTRVRWPAPWLPGAVAELPVVDVSREGLSFSLPAEHCLLTPGTPLDEAELVSQGARRALPSAMVRHITRTEGPDGAPWVRVGVSYGVPASRRGSSESTAMVEVSRGGFAERMRRVWSDLTTKLGYAAHKGRERITPVAVASTLTARRITINGGKFPLVGILDRSASGGERLKCPLVIVVPGFAGRKEQMTFLAGTLVDGFRRQHRDIAVLRFDGSNNLGESGKDPGCEAEGTHALHYTLSGLVSDVFTVLTWARSNTFVEPTHIILVSVSMSSVAVRHVLTKPESADVGLWVSYMGAPDPVDAIRLVSGNIDLHGYWQQGQKLGIVSLGGVLTDGDRFWADLHATGLTDLESARREMSEIKSDVVWVQGKHDAWMDPRRVKSMMDMPSSGAREYVEVDSGHLPRTSDVAIAQFVSITQRIYRAVHQDQLPPFSPPIGRMAAIAESEWAQVRRSRLTDRSVWWRNYLLDSEGLGFDILQFDPEYRTLMDLQAGRAAPVGGRALEMGAGTGNLTRRLLNAGVAELVATDFVPEALDAIRGKIGPDERLSLQVLDIEGTPLCAVRRWIAGDLSSARVLAERVPGVHRPSLDLLIDMADEGVHAAMIGHGVDVGALASQHRLTPACTRLLADLNLLGRHVRGRVNQDEVRVALQVLPASLLDAPMGLPFPDASFDAVAMSLVLSYLDHPEDVLFEAWRVLRPGGRLLVSSMVPDSENSKLYVDLVSRIEVMPDAEVPVGFTREKLLDSARNFVDHAAELFRIEEEGLFRFYDSASLAELVSRRGFVDVQVDVAFGNPPQAVVITSQKP